MDNPDPSGAVSAIVAILRRATRIVQIAPFVYLFAYGVYLLTSAFASEEILCMADGIMYTSPLSTIGMMAASRLFRLCRWHKAACLIPSTSQIEGYIDGYLVTLTQNEILLFDIVTGIVSIGFLIIAVRHFVYARR